MEPIVDESVEYYAPSMGADTARDLFDYPSINLGTIEGGQAINGVPQFARAEIDVRLTAGVDTSEVLSEIRECVADCDGITIADVSWNVGTDIVHAGDEYTTVDALVGNAEVYAHLPAAWAAANDPS